MTTSSSFHQCRQTPRAGRRRGGGRAVRIIVRLKQNKFSAPAGLSCFSITSAYCAAFGSLIQDQSLSTTEYAYRVKRTSVTFATPTAWPLAMNVKSPLPERLSLALMIVWKPSPPEQWPGQRSISIPSASDLIHPRVDCLWFTPELDFARFEESHRLASLRLSVRAKRGLSIGAQAAIMPVFGCSLLPMCET